MEKIIYEFLMTIRDSVLALFIDPSIRTSLPWLATSALIGFGAFYYYEVKNGKRSWDDYFSYLLPKKIYFHPSAIIDYKLILANTIIELGKRFVGVFSVGFLTQFTYDSLKYLHTPTWGRWEANGTTILIVGLFGLLVHDFSTFIGHYFGHKNKFLWRLHSLHHSAEVMTPLTNTRNHPLWGLYSSTLKNIILALSSGRWAYGTFHGINVKHFLELNFAIMIFNAAAGNLRHTHVWLSYGKYLSHILVSPAMHQIHHSLDMKHRNKNMGLIFSFWDKMFGTFQPELKEEKVIYGLVANIKTYNPIKIAFIEWIKMFKDVFSEKAGET